MTTRVDHTPDANDITNLIFFYATAHACDSSNNFMSRHQWVNCYPPLVSRLMNVAMTHSAE
ncbi:hypothetical protein ALQ16_200013 [Pseudomonas syringae pv. actinidiae]|nr:hypothetical protein ALQ16_200013 [Pseudomonas syringae pv. actinidiae]